MHQRPDSAHPDAAESTENHDTPSDTLPPRRRRRAASRPAGPPATAADTAAAETTISAPSHSEPAPSQPTEPTPATATEPTPATATEPTPATATDEPAPPRRRRRATRPASEPRPVEQAPAEPAEARADTATESPAPPEVAELTDVAETSEPAPRRRRRATRPASEPDQQPVRRRRATKAAQADAPAEDAAAEATLAGEPAPASVTPEAEPTAEADAPARAGRRRSTRAAKTVKAVKSADDAAAEATALAAAEPAAAGGEPAAEVTAEPAAEAKDAPEVVEAAPRRRRRDGKADAEPAAAEPRAARERPAAPAVVFQAPVFQAPMFQTPQRAAAEAPFRYADLDLDEELDEDEELTEETAAEPAEVEPEAGDDEAADDGGRDRPARRRRRGGRRRRRGELAERAAEAAAGEADERPAAERPAAEPAKGERPDDERPAEEPAAEPEEADEESAAEAEADEAEQGGGSSRRRRRRRRRSGDAGEAAAGDDPERTVVKVREPRRKRDEGVEAADGVQSIKGSTRLEAKKQRRREGREQGRRRAPIITEAEFLARRESVERVMVVRQQGERTQIGVLEDNVLVEHFVNKEQSSSYVGNVYLGKVQNVLPSMEAAFVDIGKGRNAVLYAGEVNFDALGLGHGPRRIETALKSGQPVLVQVTKDPIGHKGARLTSQISLPGRYLVYVPEGSMTGISRKLPDTERSRLKQILKKIVPDDAGVIVRTAAEGATEEELTRDVERLQAQWTEIQKKSKKGNAPTLLYGEPDMTVRVVRDIFNEDFSKVIVSGDAAWETIHGYVSHVAPDLADRLQRWTSEVDVFATYRIDEQLMKALDRKVWLPSGGSLVIDRTEAMVVVDVNTGRFTGQGGNLEETVTRNNLEAAEEIVRQLRLRDLGGIIVIDFIDMVLESNRDLVLRRLLECLGRDRTKHQVAEVTSLGLVQMTRKRVGQGLLESFSESCVHCNGRGVIVHMEQAHLVGGGGGKKSRRRGKGGNAPETVEVPEPVGVTEAPEPAGSEPVEPLVPAETAEVVAEPEPVEEIEPAVPAETAEPAAEPTGGRRRRRATRKVSAPAGPPKVAEEGVVTVVTAPEPEAEAAPEPAPEPEPVAVEEPRPARRRGSRKVTVPAGTPRATAEPAVLVVAHAPAAEAAEPAAAEPVAEQPAAEPAPVRRRVARRAAGAPEGAEEAVVTVVTGEPAKAEEPEPVVAEEPEQAEEPEEAPAPARKTAARKTATKTATKATAKKTTAKATAKKSTTKKAAKSAPAKKSAAKKTTAKKTVAKKTATKKSTAKKTAKTASGAASAPTEE
ncbi:Rne/Rng family ribonuclease [Streptomyces sp. DSM 44915]|uniref:Rne/Rng family ribonuclease n=1 Tax=Streptomyces chisholmiae TaxID=3075540 RepID=A0ABU2K0M1_9ACTN|nr:Rne/Rng family ribonuclease [Streptomyces sp. DSM 44915]MDT0270813.1 Rne/Rng family ribonuclease [Streptomyces sp. DSM 44915]